MSDASNVSPEDVERLEDNYDVLLFKLAAIEAVGQETIPGSVVHRLVEGEAPLLVWREHRGLSRAGLAEAAGVGAAEIESVEQDSGDLGLRKMVALAKVLRIDAEDLLPWIDATPVT